MGGGGGPAPRSLHTLGSREISRGCLRALDAVIKIRPRGLSRDGAGAGGGGSPVNEKGGKNQAQFRRSFRKLNIV